MFLTERIYALWSCLAQFRSYVKKVTLRNSQNKSQLCPAQKRRKRTGKLKCIKLNMIEYCNWRRNCPSSNMAVRNKHDYPSFLEGGGRAILPCSFSPSPRRCLILTLNGNLIKNMSEHMSKQNSDSIGEGSKKDIEA